MNIWRRLGFHDFDHFACWCPGCVGLVVGTIAGSAVGYALWWVFG